MTGKFKQKLQTIKQIIGIGKPKRKIRRSKLYYLLNPKARKI